MIITALDHITLANARGEIDGERLSLGPNVVFDVEKKKNKIDTFDDRYINSSVRM